MSRWQSAKQFCSWLDLAHGCKISGGKRLSGKTKRTANRPAAALRMAAQSLGNSQSVGRLLPKKALPPRRRQSDHCHRSFMPREYKLARIIYAMLSQGTAYEDLGENVYEEQYQQRVRRNLWQKAKKMG